MNVVIFCHSIASCWNHGNAHFLRGVVTEMRSLGWDVRAYEPADGWSAANLAHDHGRAALRGYKRAYPGLCSRMYLPATLDLDRVVRDADLVIVHEWNDPALVRRIGEHKAEGGRYKLLFHDTHHRSVTAPEEMARYDLRHYDGVLAFGDVIRDLYLRNGWSKAAWTWHEAADPRVFRPSPSQPKSGDLVWVGNWGDDERTDELREYLLEPVKRLGLNATVYGVRYPVEALAELEDAGIRYGGWLPNHEAPRVFAQHRVTVHVPRRPYVKALPGIPTIRVFEALACGLPLISAPWRDSEGLFNGDRDFGMVSSGEEMTDALHDVLNRPDFALERAYHGLRTVMSRHTCAHRVAQLKAIVDGLNSSVGDATRMESAVLL
jgi:spore maturation protein CgeB